MDNEHIFFVAAFLKTFFHGTPSTNSYVKYVCVNVYELYTKCILILLYSLVFEPTEL